MPLSFLLLRKTLPSQTIEAVPGPLCLTLGWRNQLRRLSLFQRDHHPTPCSCRAHQAPLGPLGLQVPSAALAWRFSSTSLSTCRVSARVGVGLCVHACVRLCAHARACVCVCAYVRAYTAVSKAGPSLLPLDLGLQVRELLPSPGCPHTWPQPHPSRGLLTHMLVHMYTQLHILSHMCTPQPYPCAPCGRECVISANVVTRTLSKVQLTRVSVAHSPRVPPDPA